MKRKWIAALAMFMALTTFTGTIGTMAAEVTAADSENNEEETIIIEEEPEETETEVISSEEEALSYDAAIAQLYDSSLEITDEKILEIAENMSSDFSVIEEQTDAETARQLIGVIKEFEVRKGEYFAGSDAMSAYSEEIVSTVQKQKDYMVDYVTSSETLSDAVAKVSAESCSVDGNTAVVSAEDWITVNYNEGVSAFGYTYTLTLERENDSWTIKEVGGTDANYDWLMDDAQLEEYYAAAGIDTQEGESSVEDGSIEAASLEAYYAADYTYDPDAAVAYADKWWNSANPEYPNYVSRGVDCANFVSQSIFAGGIPKSDTWKPGKYAWVNVNGQIAYLKNFGTYMTGNDSTIKKGNPVYYDWNRNNVYDHAVICVGTNSSGTPIIDSHTSARYHSTYKYRSATSIATIQLNKSGTSEDSSSENNKPAEVKKGWVSENDVWVYYENGTKKSGWLTVNGKSYYLSKKNDDHHMLTGWAKIDGKKYYFNATGVMQTGWQKISGKWYYFNTSGAVLTGWQKISSKWYYFDTSGAMLTGWQKISGKWYYLSTGGSMQTGWRKLNGSWYYMSGSGVMQSGWKKIGGAWYYMGRDGVMQTGWKKISGNWYYMNGNGIMQTGWQKISGSWYYMDGSGKMKTGWLKLNNKWYYLKNDGKLVTSAWVDRSWYADANGVCTKK